MIIATAGHVDHGKTSLVKQLTGVDTDRLLEEKKRGLSIDLGFAYRAHPQDNEKISGFIDVPGHQRFINTMIAGVSGIDLGMLVVAADDGIMPQTLEHLDILRLLGIKECVGVISKIDRVDADRVHEVTTALTTLLKSYLGSPPPLFKISSTSGVGIAALQTWLDGYLLKHQETSADGMFRMGIDRVFTLKGVGLIVTGTILAGSVQQEDLIRLLPKQSELRVRSLHAQDRDVTVALKGQRCALNLVGDIEKTDISRGDWLVAQGSGEPTRCFTASIEFLPTPVSLRHRMQVKLYIGALHVPATLCRLDSKGFLVKVITEMPVSCCTGDSFLLRDYSEQFLLGGGSVLDPWSKNSRRMTLSEKHFIDAMGEQDFAASISKLVLRDDEVIDFDHCRLAWNLDPLTAESKLQQAGQIDKLVFISGEKVNYALSAAKWRAMQETLIKMVKSWHQHHPEQPGLPLSGVAEESAGNLDVRLITALLQLLQKQSLSGEKLTVVNGIVSVSGFDQAMPEKTQKLWQEVEKILADSGLELPLVSDLEKKTRVRGREMNYLISTAIKSGRLVRISTKRVALPANLRKITAQVLALAEDKPRFTVIEFKNRIGTGRNYAIEVLDYLDSIGFTQRLGNERMVHDATVPDKLLS